jgi:hypothetical protein
MEWWVQAIVLTAAVVYLANEFERRVHKRRLEKFERERDRPADPKVVEDLLHQVRSEAKSGSD